MRGLIALSDSRGTIKLDSGFCSSFNNLYFSFGCKVFPDEASITPLIMNEYQRLLRGNEDMFSDTVSTGMQENARTGLARAKMPGECDYFKQNPDVVLEFRTDAHRAMGF
jgi:hypothetical protein